MVKWAVSQRSLGHIVIMCSVARHRGDIPGVARNFANIRPALDPQSLLHVRLLHSLIGDTWYKHGASLLLHVDG